MKTDPIRIWYITATWEKNQKRLKKEFIITAGNQENAIELAERRILKTDEEKNTINVRARDLGLPAQSKTYYSSEVLSASLQDFQDDPAEKITTDFLIAWGTEIGIRTIQPTQNEQIYLTKLKAENQPAVLMRKWAEEFLETETDQNEFFRKKLSEYLGTQIVPASEITPTDDNEYKNLIAQAKKQAEIILQTAQTEADQIRNKLKNETANLAAIAQALSLIQTGQAQMPAPIVTTTNEEPIDVPLQQTEETQDPTPVPVLTGTINDEQNPEETTDNPVEKSVETVETEPETTSDQTEISEEELNRMFPDDNEESVPDYDGPDTESDIISDEPDEEPEFEMPDDTQEQPEEEPNDTNDTDTDTSKNIQTEPAPSEVTDEILINALSNYKEEFLHNILKHLIFSGKTKNQKIIQGNAATIFDRIYTNINTIPKDKTSRAIAEFISKCQPINNMPALHYAYNHRPDQINDDTSIE